MKPTPKGFARRGGQAEQARWPAQRRAELMRGGNLRCGLAGKDRV
jgi:hypothetical protein